MSANTYQNIKLFLIVFFASAFVLGLISYAHGQSTSEKVEEVQQQVQSNNVQIDAATATAGAGIVAGGIAVVKQMLDQKTNKKRDRTTDIDAGRFIILMSKFYQAKKLYPHMSDSELLDLPVSNNPFATQTFGQAMTAEADLWADGNTVYWGAPKPNMSVPTATTVNAIKPTREDLKTVADAGIQTPITQQASTQTPTPPEAKAQTTTTPGNTTVGK